MGQRGTVQGSYCAWPEPGRTEGLDGRMAESVEGAGSLSRGPKAADSVRTDQQDAGPLRKRASGRARLLRADRTARYRQGEPARNALEVCAYAMVVAASGAAPR